MQSRVKWLPGLLWLLALVAPLAQAEPYLAVATGLKCSACHVNPDGGGMRSPYGTKYGQSSLPAHTFDVTGDRWTGDLNRYIGVGADLRGGFTWIDQKNTSGTTSFDVNSLRAYADLHVIPEMLSLYIDERIAPGNANNAETYLRLWTPGQRFYMKAGQMYLPFGIRLQDDSAYIREQTGISFNTPDRGIEFGFDGTNWTGQFAISNGTAGAPEVDDGKQWSLRTEYVQQRWRAGASFNLNDFATGLRRMENVFGGVRTGPVGWMAEVDRIQDTTAHLTQWAGLVEANWKLAQGHNVKFTVERFDPSDDVKGDAQNRLSLLYEYTPLPFIQLRAGIRNYDDRTEVPFLNQRIVFVQLHGYL